MRLITIISLGLVLLAGCQQPGPAPASRQMSAAPPGESESSRIVLPPGEDGINVCATSEIDAVLQASRQEVRITGRVSFHLSAATPELQQGRLNVHGFNLVFFTVPQRLIAGDRKIDVEQGVVGFAASTADVQRLEYDPATGVIKGKLRGFVGAAYMGRLVKKGESDGPNDEVPTVTQPATLSLTLRPDRPLDPKLTDVHQGTMQMGATLDVERGEADGKPMPEFRIELPKELKFPFEFGRWVFEVARQLAIQPVRVARIQITPSRFGIPHVLITLTGEGLAFGQPGASTQWRKADVVFSYRDWKTIFNSSFLVVSASEESNLRSQVQDSDAVEVFFVQDFDPVDAHGGGVTFSSGQAEAQIISSDANARGGIDLTHLAHELGHALGLRHPDAPATATAQPGSTGTLICPSGFLRDNPTRNSQENKDKVSNPLLTFTLKLRSAGPDCQNSADCGACP